MAPAARPSSPTSLLWAHQLKNEHGHLLKRMRDLESANQKQENRIQAAEAAASSASASSDFVALAEKVRVLDEGRLGGMERDVARRFDDVQAESEAVITQVEALREGREQRGESDKALLRRISEVEAGLRKYESALDRMGRRIDGTQFELIKEQLEGLSRQVRQEGEGMKMLGESVSALEAANEELKRANERLEVELGKVNVAKTSTVADTRPARSVEAIYDDSGLEPDVRPMKRPKKKSHKWAGGGADKDIIRTGSGLVERSPLSTPEHAQAGATVSSKKKSHKWAGGGTDKGIIQAGSSSQKAKPKPPGPKVKKPQPPQLQRKVWVDRDGMANLPKKKNPQSLQLKRKAPSEDDERIETPRPQKKTKKSHKWSGGGADKDILRAGKGWYEVACSPTRDEPEASSLPPKKRGPGRPRKVPTPQWTQEEAFAQGRVTRRTTLQPSQMQQPAGKKRKVNASLDVASEEAGLLPPVRRPNGATTPAAKSRMTPEMKKRPEPNVFSSPVSSSPPMRADDVAATPEEIQVPRSDNGNTQPSYAAQGPPKRRREVVQVDDISTFIRGMSG